MSVRRLVVTTIFAGALWAQPATNVPFDGLTATSSSRKPARECKDLRSLTSVELSVIGAILITASADAPEHCTCSETEGGLASPPIHLGAPTRGPKGSRQAF